MKERLTDAALDLMWGNSYGPPLRWDAICERAGAKREASYYFFKSKSELTAAATGSGMEQEQGELDALFSPTVPLSSGSYRYFDYVHDRLAERQKKVRLHPWIAPILKHRERSEHAGPGRARYR